MPSLLYTNEFKVKNSKKFYELLNNLKFSFDDGDEGIEVFQGESENTFKFCTYGNLEGYILSKENEKADWELALKKLQEILCDSETLVIIQTIASKLRLSTGYLTIITPNEISECSLLDAAISIAKD